MKEAPFPIDPVMTGIAIAYSNEEYIADAVLPRAPVGLQSYKYKKYDLGETFRIPDTHVGRTGKPNEIEFTYTEATDSTVDHGLEDPVPQSDINNSAGSGYNPVAAATENLTDLVLLDREKRVADLVFASATYAGNTTTLSGTDQWSDGANSDPLGVILDTMDAMVMRPNVMVIGQAVYRQLQTHPKILGALNRRDTAYGRANKQFLADLFEVQQVLVGAAWHASNREGQTTSMARLWGKHCALLRVNPQASNGQMPTFGFTAQWGTRVAGSRQDPDIGLRGGTRVRVGESVKETITATDMGHLIINAVA